jgi:hypothetical protein
MESKKEGGKERGRGEKKDAFVVLALWLPLGLAASFNKRSNLLSR